MVHAMNPPNNLLDLFSDPPTDSGALRGRLEDPETIRTFALAGNAILTVASRRTGVRFTYRIRAPFEGGAFKVEQSVRFVAVLTGADNANDYTYLGTLQEGVYHHGRKSRIGEEAPSAAAFRWFWRVLDSGRIEQCEVWHEGRCGKCGRKLTVPESVARGLGPDCAAMMGL